MWAIHRNSPKMVKILVAASASISESDLKLANKTRNKEIIDILEYSMSFDPYIKEYVSLLYNVRNNEEKSRDTWHKSTKDKSGNFYRLPEPIQHLLNNSFTIISEGPSSFFNNISNKQNKFERILDNPKSNSPAEFLSNEDILITRLKSELKEFF